MLFLSRACFYCCAGLGWAALSSLTRNTTQHAHTHARTQGRRPGDVLREELGHMELDELRLELHKIDVFLRNMENARQATASAAGATDASPAGPASSVSLAAIADGSDSSDAARKNRGGGSIVAREGVGRNGRGAGQESRGIRPGSDAGNDSSAAGGGGGGRGGGEAGTVGGLGLAVDSRLGQPNAAAIGGALHGGGAGFVGQGGGGAVAGTAAEGGGAVSLQEEDEEEEEEDEEWGGAGDSPLASGTYGSLSVPVRVSILLALCEAYVDEENFRTRVIVSSLFC